MNSLTCLHRFDLAAHVEDDFQPPARFTPRSRVSDRMVSSCSRSSSEYSRVLPSVREGFSSPSRLAYRKRLRVDAVLLRHRADHVIRLAAASLRHTVAAARCSIFPNVIVVAPPELRISSRERSSTSCGSTSRACTIRSPRLPSSVGARGRPGTAARPASRRQRQPEGTVEWRHLDPRAEHRFVNRDGNLDVEVVAFAPEQRVRRNMDDDTQIAGRSPMPPRVPLSPRSEPCSVDRSRRNHDGNAFGPHHRPAPHTPAAPRTLTAGAATGRARLREHHMARPPDTPVGMTVRTSSSGVATLPLPRQD